MDDAETFYFVVCWKGPTPQYVDGPYREKRIAQEAAFRSVGSPQCITGTVALMETVPQTVPSPSPAIEG